VLNWSLHFHVRESGGTSPLILYLGAVDTPMGVLRIYKSLPSWIRPCVISRLFSPCLIYPTFSLQLFWRVCYFMSVGNSDPNFYSVISYQQPAVSLPQFVPVPPVRWIQHTPFHPISLKGILILACSFKFPYQNSVCISPLLHNGDMPRHFLSLWGDYQNTVWPGVHSLKFFVVHVLPVFCYLLSHRHIREQSKP
jgi:hypothetical protein